MMSHIDCWATLAAMVGLTPPPHGEWKDNDGKPIYFDSIDNSAYILGKAQHSARTSWIYIDGENFGRCAPTSAAIPRTPTSTSPGSISVPAKDTWLGPKQDLGRSARSTTSPWTPTRNTT